MFLCELNGYAPAGGAVRFDGGVRARSLMTVAGWIFGKPTLTLAAYVRETLTLRFDPRDMAKIRIFHEDKFLCRALCAELAGETVPLREILRARSRRRRELRGVLRDREIAVNTLLDLKRGETRCPTAKRL